MFACAGVCLDGRDHEAYPVSGLRLKLAPAAAL
jgi:hypothetical protein